MPDAVVDIGNSRIKLCRCDRSGLVLPIRGLPADDLVGCERLAEEWGFAAGHVWAVAATHPARAKQFADWAASRGEMVVFIDSPEAIPIAVAVDFPDRVGIDRLLNAFAARAHVRPGRRHDGELRRPVERVGIAATSGGKLGALVEHLGRNFGR